MHVNRIISLIVIFLFIVGCNLPSNQTTPAPFASRPPTRDTTPSPFPIETPLTFLPPTVTSTVTPSLVLAFPLAGPVNCRSGPGISYNVVGELRVDRQAEVIGKSADLAWWYVKNPSDPSTYCWLAADFTITQGNVDGLAVVSPPEIVVTAVQVSIDPPVLNVACDAFPRLVTINVRITTNGPATVLWRWEEVSTGDVSSDNNILFEEGGTRSVEDLYQVRSARDYQLIVRTLLPNEAMGQATFKAVCTP